MAIEAARLVAIVEVQNADAAARQLQNFGTQIDKAGQSAQRSGGGFAALDKHALNASQRAQVAGTNFAAMGRGVDTAGKQAATAGTSMARAGDGATKAGTGAQKATGFFGGFREQMVGANAASIAASAGMVGLAAGVGMAANAAVSAGINYESAFAGVAKTVDATESELDSLSISIRNMATEIPVAATEIAGIAEAAGALGVAKGDILAFTETAALIGVTTDVSSDQAATSLGQLSNVLNLTADDYERFGSTLVDLGNQGASTESAILGIASRSGAASELIGMATEETLAWGSAVANLGIEAQAGGSSLQTFFISTAKMVSETGAELDMLAETAGMTGEAFATMFADDSSAALQTFISGLGQLDQAQQLATLSALGFNDVRITRTLLGLASNTDNLTSSLKTAEKGWKDNTAMAVEAEKRFDTTASKLTILKNQATDAAISGFGVLGPAIGETTVFMGDFLESIPPAVEGLTEFIQKTKEIGTGEAAPDYSSFEGFFGFIISQADLANQAVKDSFDWINNDMPTLNLLGMREEDVAKSGVTMAQWSADLQKHVEGLIEQRDALQEAGQGFTEYGNQSEMAGEVFINTAQVIRDSQQAMGAGFTEFGMASESAATQSTASFDRFATAFQGNVETATSSIGEIAIAASSGAVDFEDAMGLYAGIPRDVLVPAVTEAAAELRGKLADATLSEEDARAVQGQVNALKAIFPDLVAEIDGVAGAFGNFGAIQDQFQSNIALAGEGVSEWQGHLSGAETALGFLQDKLDNGVALTDREIEQYDILTGAVDRYTGGINDESAALVDAEVAKAEFIGRQDELNQALSDGKITQDEYNSAIAEAAGGLDPMIAGQAGLAEVTGTVIDKLRDFMIELGLIPPDVETDLVVDDADANLTLDQYMEKYGTMPDPPPTVPSVDKADADMSINDYVAKTGSMPDPPPTAVTADTAGAMMNLNEYIGTMGSIEPSVSTSIAANTSSAVGALQELIAMATATRTMHVNIVSSGGVGAGFTEFADGGISQGGLALVGEQGPEFVVLPKGAEVITAPETMAMMAGMPWLGGFAAGTGSIINDSKSVNHGIINASAGTGFVETGMDIGEQIWQGIGIAMSAGAFDDYTVSGEQIADAMLKGAVTKIESDSSDVADTWVVNMDRVPELASQIGQDTAMALLEEYAKLQGELQLAILSGDDTGEINAQLAAIEALFVEWGISVIGTATSVADVMADIARADHFGNMFSLPSTPANYSLDDIISGDAQQTIRQDFHDIWDLQKIATELGYDEFAAELGQQMAALGLDEEFVNAVIKSDTGQKMAAEAAAAMESAALGDIMNDYTIEEIFSGDAIAQIGEVKASLQEKHDIALALGDEALAAEYAAMIAEMEAQEVRVNVIMDTGVGDGAVAAAEWEVRIDNATTGPNFGAGIQDDIDALDLKIDLGNLAGAPSEVIAGWEAEKEALVEQSEQYWYDIARGAANGLYDDETLAAYAEAGGAQFEAYLGEFLSPEGAAAMIEGINDITDASIGQIQAAFDAAPEMAAGFIDDIVMGVNDGRFDVGQAFGLLASIPRDEMLPVLDELEEKWTVDLVQAIVDGNIELEASLLELLETLGLIKAEAEATAAVDPFPWLHDGGPAGLPSSNGSSVPGNLSSTLSGSRTGWNYSGGNRETQQAHYDKQLKYYQDRSPGYQAWASMQEPTRAAVIPLANGAVINEPLLALMGESGTEMVQPLSAGHPERQRFIEDVTASVVKVLGVSGNQQAPIFMLGTRPFVAETNKAIMSGRISRRGPR